MEKHYHTSDWASYEMLQSANALRSLAVADNGQAKEDPFLFLTPSILMAYTAIQTRANEAVEEYLQKHEKSFPVNYVRKVAKQAPLHSPKLAYPNACQIGSPKLISLKYDF